jgi:DNA polymerase III subunit epsilon
MRQIILDTETTGLEPKDGHRVIEIGCLEIINRRITGDTFHRYINPQRPVERGAEEVHGITDDFLQAKPVFQDIVDEFIDYIKDAELIIHNAPFDVGFLNHEFKLIGKNLKTINHYCGVIDTLAMARRQHPGQHNSLDALCKRYQVDNSNRDLHGALLDAELLAQVYLLMTGGQVQLFQTTQDSETATNKTIDIKRVAKEREALKVVMPTTAELAAHEKFAQMLAEEAAND